MKKQMIVILAVTTMLIFASGSSMAAGNVKAGKVKSATCSNCHGAAGEGKDANPKLAGLEAAYIIKQLEDFKSGARKSMMMGMFAGTLDHMDMADLAAYYSSLK